MRMKVTPEKQKHLDSGLGLDPGLRLGSTPLRRNATGGVVSAVSHPQLTFQSQFQHQQHQAYGASPPLPVSIPVSVPKVSRGVGTSCDLEDMKWQENGKMNSGSKAEAEVPVLTLSITKANAEISKPKQVSGTVTPRKTEGSAKERSLEAKSMVPKKPRGRPRKIKKPDDVIRKKEDKDLVERLRSTVVVESGAEEEEEREVFLNSKADKPKSASGSRMKYQDVVKPVQEKRIVDSYDDIQEERTDDEEMTSERNEAVERMPDAKKEIQPVSKKRGRPNCEQPAETKEKEEEQAVISKRRATAEREDAKNPDEISVPVASTAAMAAVTDTATATDTATDTATIQAPNPNPTMVLAQCAPLVNRSTRVYDEMRLAGWTWSRGDLARIFNELVDDFEKVTDSGVGGAGSAFDEMRDTLEMLKEYVEEFCKVEGGDSEQGEIQLLENTAKDSILQAFHDFQTNSDVLMRRLLAALRSNTVAPLATLAAAQNMMKAEPQQLLHSEQHLNVAVPTKQESLRIEPKYDGDQAVSAGENHSRIPEKNVLLHESSPGQISRARVESVSDVTPEILPALALQHASSHMVQQAQTANPQKKQTKPRSSPVSRVEKARNSKYLSSDSPTRVTRERKQAKANQLPASPSKRSVDLAENPTPQPAIPPREATVATRTQLSAGSQVFHQENAPVEEVIRPLAKDEQKNRGNLSSSVHKDPDTLAGLRAVLTSQAEKLKEELSELKAEKKIVAPQIVLARFGQSGKLYPAEMVLEFENIRDLVLTKHPLRNKKTGAMATHDTRSFVLVKWIGYENYSWILKDRKFIRQFELEDLDSAAVTRGSLIRRTEALLFRLKKVSGAQ